jgi:porin
MNIGRIRLAVIFGLGGGLAGLTPTRLLADPSNTLERLMDRSTLTRSWGWVRKELANDGIGFFGNYLSMYAANVSGSEKQAATYAQQVTLGMSLDSPKIDPGLIERVKFLSSLREGNSISSNAIGNYAPVQAVDGEGEGYRIVDISYAASFNGRRTLVDARFLPLGDDYAAIQDFIHLPSDALNEHSAWLYMGRGWTDFSTGISAG